MKTKSRLVTALALAALAALVTLGVFQGEQRVQARAIATAPINYRFVTGLAPGQNARGNSVLMSRRAGSSSVAIATPCNGRLTEVYYPLVSTPTTFPSAFPGTLRTGGVVLLQGYLYLPGNRSIVNSQKDLPVIVFNHGSGQPVNQGCEMATYFTDRGFAFFIPHRRGHGDSTGVFYGDWINHVCPGNTCSPAERHAKTLEYLKDQNFEVARAIEYLLRIRNGQHERVIDPDKIAIMGHSFGGMVTLFNNAVMTDHQAAVDIAGASESWEAYDTEDGNFTPDDSDSIDTLKHAVRSANKPLFFFEPKNDVSTRPTIVLSKVAGDADERYQAAIYGPVPLDPGEDSTNAHGKFVIDKDQVEKWGPAVIEFLARYGVK